MKKEKEKSHFGEKKLLESMVNDLNEGEGHTTVEHELGSEKGAIELYRDEHHCFLKGEDVEICPAYNSAIVVVSNFYYKHKDFSSSATPQFAEKCKGCFVLVNYNRLNEKIKEAENKKEYRKEITKEKMQEIKRKLGIIE